MLHIAALLVFSRTLHIYFFPWHKQETKWLKACMGMQWSREQIRFEIISIHATKGNLAKPSPTLSSTIYFFSQVHSEIFRVLPSIASIQSCSRSTQLITGCYLNFIVIVSKFQSANAFTIETSNEHIKQNIYGRIFSRAFLHAKRHSNMRQKAKKRC